MASKAKIALLGTGAIGASVARALYLNKVHFTILVRDKKRKGDLVARGIRYTLEDTTHIDLKQGAEVLTLAEAQKKAGKDRFDFIFLGMKTPHLKEAAKTAKALLAKGGRIVLLQNGLPENELHTFKAEQVISGIVGYNTQLMPDGSYFQSNPGHLILANASRPPHELKALLEPHLPVVISANALGFRWNKLAINSVINGLGAVSGLALGPLFAKQSARRAAIGLIEEAAAVMRARQIEEGIVPGAISVYRFARLPAFIQHLMLFVLGLKYAKIRTSMLQDVERGVKTEVDQIHGAIVAAAKQAGIEVPLTEAIVQRVHALEKGELKPGLGLLPN
ncbi:MAG: ketopantoate reductase family protein [Spirochaetota bacterium]